MLHCTWIGQNNNITRSYLNPYNQRGRGNTWLTHTLIHFFILHLRGRWFIFGPQLCAKWDPESLEAA